MKDLLVIIPAFNEEKSLPKLVNEISANFPMASIVIVNDCSTDNTMQIAEKLGVIVLNLPINLGIGGAMQTGYKYAQANNYYFAVQVDGDGQHNPSEIKKLLEVQEKTQANLVIGSRFLEKPEYKQSFFRMLGINFFAFITKLLTHQRITDATSGFRLADKKVISLYANYYPSDYPEPEVLVYLHNKGMKIVETQVKMEQRKSGKSSITPLRSVYYMAKVICAMFMQRIRG